MKKKMKLNKKKLTLYVLLIVMILFFSFHFLTSKNTIGVTTTSTIPVQNIIDKQLIIKELKEKMQIVGLESDIKKEFGYTDNKWYGDRTYKMNLHGTFKMGINIDEIKPEDIEIVNNNDIIITLPNIILVSLEVPYDSIKINKDVGLFRSDFSESDRQLIYKEAYKSIKEEILNDMNIKNNATISTQNSIKRLLNLIPNVNNIYFK